MFRTGRFPAVAALLAVGALGACTEGMMGGMGNPFASASGGDAFTPVTTEAAFREQVVGREVVYANGAVGSYGENGTWNIDQDGARIGSGSWTWEGDRWCSEGTTAAGPAPRSCDEVAVSDAGVRFTREDGTEGVLPFRS